MKNQKKYSALFFSVFLVTLLSLNSCRDISHEPAGITANLFTIKYGDYVYLDNMGLSIQFLDLLDDSRCAKNAICVWAGRADLKLSVSVSGKNQSIITLRIDGYVKESDTNAHITLDTLGYKFTLMNLDPYPDVNVKRDLSQYSALISITKK